MKSKRKNRIISRVILYIILIAVTFIFLFPLIWIVSTSFKTTSEIFNGLYNWIPIDPTLDNYIELFTTTDFFPAMGRSLVIAFLTAFIAVIVSSLAAYGFARYSFRGRHVILNGILLLYMFPTVLYLTPLFLVFRQIGILGTAWCLLISNCTFTIPFSISLLTTYIHGIPKELEEAAEIDGAGLPQRLVRIVFPLLKPGVVATASYVFISAWNEYLFAVMFTSSATRTLTVSLASLVGQYDIRWDMISAGAVTAIIPVVIIFLVFQRNLVEVMTAGAVKG